MKTPTILSCPIYTGKVSRRVAKKHIRNKYWFKKNHPLANLGLGDYVNDCSGYNGKILEIEPIYVTLNGRWHFLAGIDITTTNGGCSVGNCGIEPAKSNQEINKNVVRFLREWTLGKPGENWYGAGSDEHKEVVARAHKIISVIDSGGFITDAHGQILKEFKGRI